MRLNLHYCLACGALEPKVPYNHLNYNGTIKKPGDSGYDVNEGWFTIQSRTFDTSHNAGMSRATLLGPFCAEACGKAWLSWPVEKRALSLFEDGIAEKLAAMRVRVFEEPERHPCMFPKEQLTPLQFEANPNPGCWIPLRECISHSAPVMSSIQGDFDFRPTDYNKLPGDPSEEVSR